MGWRDFFIPDEETLRLHETAKNTRRNRSKFSPEQIVRQHRNTRHHHLGARDSESLWGFVIPHARDHSFESSASSISSENSRSSCSSSVDEHTVRFCEHVDIVDIEDSNCSHENDD
mmetsp:Transcript_44038/g.108115  ORF Transcript_44038/g.108115 Transcript_44038/m.108115 type:complete len:116 (+) Transcript_44038:231-578(+)